MDGEKRERDRETERQGDKETRRQGDREKREREREKNREREREAQSLNHHGFSLPCMHHDNSPLL